MRACLAAVVLAGCSARATPYVHQEDAPSTSVLVVTSRVSGAAERTTAQAAFVRVLDGGSTADAARMLGFEPDLPREGECRAVEVARSASAVSRLVDVGEVWLEGGDGTRLVARAFPDVLGVSGVMYTSGGEVKRLGSEARLRWTGGDDVDGDDVALGIDAPTLDAHRVGGAVSFTPGEPGDRTWVDVTGSRGTSRCVVARGSGAFTVDELDGWVSVHRDRTRTDAAVTVRREVTEVLGPALAPSGS